MSDAPRQAMIRRILESAYIQEEGPVGAVRNPEGFPSVSRGSFHRTATLMKAQKGEEKVVGELSGNIQGVDGIEDERVGRYQRERVVGGSRSSSIIAFEVVSRGGWGLACGEEGERQHQQGEGWEAPPRLDG